MFFSKYNSQHADGLNLHRALPGRLLIVIVAAMTFLAALTLGEFYGSYILAKRWNTGAASIIILQIPDPDAPLTTPEKNPLAFLHSRIQRVIGFLSTQQELSSFHRLTSDEVNELLAPWLGNNTKEFALPIPAIIELHLKNGTALSSPIKESLHAMIPDLVIGESNFWNQRLTALANSLQASASLSLIAVMLVAIAVVTLATQTGLSKCRQTIEILHNLGASDHYIAQRFAKRNAILTFVGGVIGVFCSFPLLFFLIKLCLPFSSDPNWQQKIDQSWYSILTALPFSLAVLLFLLPLLTYLLGWITTQFIVYCWLRRLT